MGAFGLNNRFRTDNLQGHNLMLYQLSYVQHMEALFRVELNTNSFADYYPTARIAPWSKQWELNPHLIPGKDSY